MKFQGFLPAVLFALVLPLPAAAQLTPDYLAHPVPTAPDRRPLSSDKSIADYQRDGYAIVLRTRFVGRFEGCQVEQEFVFEDRSQFVCGESVMREEISPEVRILRDAHSGEEVLFIGKRAYVGRLRWLKGVPLHEHIRFGDQMLGVPNETPSDRRAIGPVDVTNGKIPVNSTAKSLYNGTIRESSAYPTTPPEKHTSLNPDYVDPRGK